MSELLKVDFGPHLHSMVLLGTMTEVEVKYSINMY